MDPSDIDSRILYTAKGSFCSCSTRLERFLKTIKIPHQGTVNLTSALRLCGLNGCANMMIWTGMWCDKPMCRTLGPPHGQDGTFSIPGSVQASQELSHNEGTLMSGWTSPSIGVDNVKDMRDYADIN